MRELLEKIMEKSRQFLQMGPDSSIVFIILVGMIFFGLMNCILGYRLLRFWMMIGGIALGAGLGYLLVDALIPGNPNYYIFGSAGCGILFGVIAFMIYKAGIWAIGTCIGTVSLIYFLRPNSYGMLFVCILVGIAIGVLAVKYSRIVFVTLTSIAGGLLAGFAAIRMAEYPVIPYGILAGAALAICGML
ncbi:MAG: DUF4203 domain-containing protein, partial [Clostridiales bacterium]|nr:DUF4203 domain-containing protein [Candidatus Blautia equi]